jgi:glycosyltransferase involved in cell wall biosynthesis
MRIAIISPYSAGPMRGNITTVTRIAHALDSRGAETMVLPMDVMSQREMEQRLRAFAPGIIHGFHAGYCGEMACNLARRGGVPCVITITGGDINEVSLRDLPGTGRALAEATAVVCFDDLAAAEVTRFFPSTVDRLVIIPQGIEPLPVAPDACFAIPDNAFVLLLPAAFRPVKNIAFPVQAMAPLIHDRNSLLLVIAGGVIDQGYASHIREMLDRAPYATWLGEVPYAQMGALYARADVVLNCSLFEGMPNSLLEAMALGRPVLAADIPGNRSLVRDNETGWLYRDEADFRRHAVRLASDAALRAEGGRRAREYVLAHFTPTLEAERYLGLYGRLAANRTTC